MFILTYYSSNKHTPVWLRWLQEGKKSIYTCDRQANVGDFLQVME